MRTVQSKNTKKISPGVGSAVPCRNKGFVFYGPFFVWRLRSNNDIVKRPRNVTVINYREKCQKKKKKINPPDSFEEKAALYPTGIMHRV